MTRTGSKTTANDRRAANDARRGSKDYLDACFLRARESSFEAPGPTHIGAGTSVCKSGAAWSAPASTLEV